MFVKQLLRACVLLGFFIISGRMDAQERNILNPDQKSPGQNIDIEIPPYTKFTIGGAIWLRSSFQDWEQDNSANRRGSYFDQFRLSVSGSHGFNKGEGARLTFSAQARWWSYMFAIQHMWIGIEFNENHELRYGISQAPFGALPSVSSSFWYSLNYYHGLEGDHDTGFQYIYKKGGDHFHAAYFRNEEYNDPTATNRWAPDLVVAGDQQNFERHQVNLRYAKVLGYGTNKTSEFGVSGQWGQIRNPLRDGNGNHWAAAFHYVGNYNDWNFNFQATRYEYDPNNPDGVDDRTVLMGFFSDTRLVASKATTFVGNVRRYWDIEWWLFDKLNVYLEYSTVIKDEDTFKDSRMINPGAVLQAGPFYIWFDMLFGQNAWWMNDNFANSGPGAGAVNPDKFELRGNLSVQWYF